MREISRAGTAVILSVAKNLAYAAISARFFAALRMTRMDARQKFLPHASPAAHLTTIANGLMMMPMVFSEVPLRQPPPSVFLWLCG